MREKIIFAIDASPNLEYLRRYFNSIWYLITIGCLVVFGYTTGQDLFAMIVGAVLVCASLVICADLRPTMAMTLIAVFYMSVGHSPIRLWMAWYWYPSLSRYFLEGAPLVILITILVTIAVFFVFHCWLRGVWKRIFTTRTRLVFWALPLVAALLANGIFAEGYTIKNLLYGIVTALTWVGIYLIYYHGIRHDARATRYIMQCLVMAAIVLMVEFLWIEVTPTHPMVLHDQRWQDRPFYGWGINNNLAGLIAILIPAFYYRAARCRHGWIWWCMGPVALVCILMTKSRSSLLLGGFVMVASWVVVCFVGRHKKLYRIFLIAAASAGVLAAIAVAIIKPSLFVKIYETVFRGFDDVGRFDLWRNGAESFLVYPVFGVGFFNITFNSWTSIGLPGFSHNTLVQMLASGGAVGLLTYLVYRVRTVTLFVRKPSSLRIFLGLMMISLLGISLLDNHMFNIYPAFYYSLILALAEHDLEDTLAMPKKAQETTENATETEHTAE